MMIHNLLKYGKEKDYLKVNADKSKVMVLGEEEGLVYEFGVN